ncbi:unnamed protein product [Discosporangium mesarthrocarpum]
MLFHVEGDYGVHFVPVCAITLSLTGKDLGNSLFSSPFIPAMHLAVQSIQVFEVEVEVVREADNPTISALQIVQTRTFQVERFEKNVKDALLLPYSYPKHPQ